MYIILWRLWNLALVAAFLFALPPSRQAAEVESPTAGDVAATLSS